MKLDTIFLFLFVSYRHLGVAISITSVYHNLPHNKHLSTENHPYFDIDDSGNTNLTVIQGENAYFVCIVRNLGNNSISFLRHKDVNLLSVGKYVYTQDPRYQIFHNANNDTWTMKISRVTKKDEGMFQCQFGRLDAQPVGRMIYLKVIDPDLSILEGDEKFTEVGSNINLTCYISQTVSEEKANSLRWTHNNQEINHLSPRVLIITNHRSNASISNLMIKNLTPADFGLYSCYTSMENRASIFVHVLAAANDDFVISSSSRKALLFDVLAFINLILSLYYNTYFRGIS